MKIGRAIFYLHGAAEMIAQNVEQFHLGRAIHGNRDPVAFADAHGHHLHGMRQVSMAGAHFQGTGGVGIAAGQICQLSGTAKQHGKIVLQGTGKGFHRDTSWIPDFR